MRSEGYCSRPVCQSVCPGLFSATHATTRPSRHTYGLSIVLAPDRIWRFSYNGLVSKIAIALPYSRSSAIFIRPYFHACGNVYAHVLGVCARRNKGGGPLLAICLHRIPPRVLHFSVFINPRRACAARVTVVVLCVCVCVRGPHLQLAQLSDKVGILAVSVSCSLVFKKGVFRTIAFWRS